MAFPRNGCNGTNNQAPATAPGSAQSFVPGFATAAVPGWEPLFDPAAEQRIAWLEQALDAGTSAFALGSRLRAEQLPGEAAAAFLTQAELRRKARSKFGSAARGMLFTQAGLEQASRASIARRHAERYAHAGLSTVADLGCGIGSESLALLAAGVNALAVEIDPFTARIAEHNLASAKLGARTASARVIVAAAQSVSLKGVDGAFLDPARRTPGHRNTKRLSNPDDYSPSLSFAFGLAERMPTGVKLGPGFDRRLLPDGAEAQWVSIDGQLVETGVWFGQLARNGVARSALVLRGSEAYELTARADAGDVAEQALGEYLYEPNGAVIRARLIGLLAEQINAGPVSEGIAYLTADTLTPTPFAQAFRVLEQLPSSEKQLRRELRARDIGNLEIKKRGADVDPAALRTRLKLKGSNSATLFLTRAGGKHTALLTERV